MSSSYVPRSCCLITITIIAHIKKKSTSIQKDFPLVHVS
jgi:hypothetical protein